MQKAKKVLISKWYKTVKPVGKYIDQVGDNYYRKKVDAITQDKAIEWLVGDILRYMVRYNKGMRIIVADYIDTEEVYGFNLRYRPGFVKREKTRLIYHKMVVDINIQNRVIEKLRGTANIVVIESSEMFGGQRVDNYQATYDIKIRE